MENLWHSKKCGVRAHEKIKYLFHYYIIFLIINNKTTSFPYIYTRIHTIKNIFHDLITGKKKKITYFLTLNV